MKYKKISNILILMAVICIITSCGNYNPTQTNIDSEDKQIVSEIITQPEVNEVTSIMEDDMVLDDKISEGIREGWN